MEHVAGSSELTPIQLGGRNFREIDFNRRTVAIDHYLSKVLRQTGADKVMPMDNEGNDEYLIRMQTLLVDSGKLPELIGGYLLPEGIGETEWTTAMATMTAKHVRQCNTAHDRELVLQIGMNVAFGFFQQGLDWLNRSLSSLRKTIPSPENRSQAH
jgi:hypothetical protein